MTNMQFTDLQIIKKRTIMQYLKSKRIVVTGGAGFLGKNVVAQLKEHGCKDIFVPRSKDYDLVDMDAVKRLYEDARPDIVIHLAAVVGGIGANSENPGQFFYDNMMMGAQLMEQGRLNGMYVLDASVVIKWFSEEEYTDKAVKLRDDFLKEKTNSSFLTCCFMKFPMHCDITQI